MDITNDECKDIIVGHKNGHLKFYTGKDDGTFHEEGRVIDDRGYEITTREYSSPVLIDWDEDGLVDLLIAGDREPVRFYKNIGTKEEPLFQLSKTYSALEESRPQLQIVDLNGDSIRDVVMGTMSGVVHYYENTGTNSTPQFSLPVMLKSNGEEIQIPLNNGKQNAFPAIADWNGDGALDLIMGHPKGTLLFYPGLQQQESIVTQTYVEGVVVKVLGNSLYISHKQSILHVSVYLVNGKRVFSGIIDNGTIPISLSRGQYILTVEINRNIYTQLIKM